MKIYIAPDVSLYGEDGKGSGGIWRVICAQNQWLPEYGIEVVHSEKEADIVNCHAGELVTTKKPVVASNHGAYWTGDFAWDREYWQFNAQVIEVLRRAATIITPSEWVAHAIRRDMRKPVYVIPHGVNIEDFEPGDDNGYVLWAKPRVDVVSDPEPLNKLVALALDTQFTATFGRPAENVRITGAMAHSEFKELMRGASVWLATTRETGDIASREAMAMGIPVLAWNWGATGELVKHKETGYLAKPGDYEDLLEGLHYCLENRDRLGAAGREDIRANYQWRNLMAHYAAVYKDTFQAEQYPVDVSIIVPAHNYASFLTECLYSIKNQRFTGTVETIVVDDASTDNTQEVLSHFDITAIKHQTNQGLVGSLNTGRAVARGKYLMNLDADNLIPQNTLQTLYDELEAKPWLDVASGGLAIYSPTGQHQTANDWPFGMIKVADQFAHINQQHSSAMVRARSVRGLGGYRTRQRKNEDGEYWCRAISAGLRFEQVTRNPTLVYRWHDKNKSKLEGGEDAPDGVLSWSFYFPWGQFPSITPFACTADAPNASWPVHSYENPHIAVIIPCGPGHEKFLPDA